MPKPPPRPNYTQAPNVLFDEWLAPGVLTEAELRVVLYICRRTFGWHKDRDKISLEQLTDGQRRHDGSHIDYGAGIKRAAALRAIKSLEAAGLVCVMRHTAPDGRNETTEYSLNIAPDPNDPSRDSLGTPRESEPAPSGIFEISDGESLGLPQKNTVKENQKNGSAPPVSSLIYGTALLHAPALGLRGDVAHYSAANKALALWGQTGLSEAAFVARLEQAAEVARTARGDKAAAYWAAVEAGK